MPIGLNWDASLYRGSASHYLRGRPPYAPALTEVLASVVPFDRHARVLDVGCGPGVIGVPLAYLVAEIVGVDPDPDMLAEASRYASATGATNCTWLEMRAEEIPPDIGPFRAVIFGQSFHWMDRALVAERVRDMIEPGGALVHIADWKAPRTDLLDLPYPTPPYEAIRGLVQGYLGPVQRAGQGVLAFGSQGDEDTVLTEAGYRLEQRIAVPANDPFIRHEDEVVSWVYSLSSSAPHLFSDDLPRFEHDLRALLREASPTGLFADQPVDTDVRLWRVVD